MLLKFWFVASLCAATVNTKPSFTAATPFNLMECASSIPCIKTSTLKTATISTTTLRPPPTPNKAICKNCPLPDCAMVSNGTTFPYANHCKLFYQCIDAVAEICVCPNGYWYDRVIAKCLLCDLVSNCIANRD